MVLSYARGSWRFKVASSVAVAIKYGNVGGSFSGNEELVADLMAECRMWWQKWGQPYFGGKGGGNFAWQKLSRKFSNHILVAAEVSKFDGSFLAEKVANTFSDKKASGVHGTCWQKGCERLFGGKWGRKLMAKVLAKFGATSTIERDVDENHGNPIAPSTEATPTDPVNKKQYMIGCYDVFNNPFAGGAKAASAQRTLVLSRQSAIVFGCHHCPSKNRPTYFCQK